jgi:signal-transduction protein with cAMP-binding, CBS, and nucleotidyltransferase domain
MDDVKFDLFELLPESERLAEMQKLKLKNYHAGQVLYEQGDISDLYFIFSGDAQSKCRINSAQIRQMRDGPIWGRCPRCLPILKVFPQLLPLESFLFFQS